MKRGTLRLICVGAIALSLSGCVMNRVNPEPQTIVLRDNADSTLRVEIKPGAHWSSRMQAGPFIFNVLPQFAIWTEDDAGTLVETLYVSGADFGGMRHAARNEKQAEFFAQSLPVWSARIEATGALLPSKANPYPDTVTSATPTGPTTLVTALTGSAGATTIYLEINKPGNENSTFTKEENEWVGQPSLVYAGGLVSGSSRLELIGHGGLLRDEPGIYSDLTGFDTALEQVVSIVVTLE
ncbi:MAG: hypothetical protein EA426_01490 [Spirochaetaceae bacterium]|nr:MAG: hypothetical protein EA426_01490 [Spirochaetaceae bacterium]